MVIFALVKRANNMDETGFRTLKVLFFFFFWSITSSSSTLLQFHSIMLLSLLVKTTCLLRQVWNLSWYLPFLARHLMTHIGRPPWLANTFSWPWCGAFYHRHKHESMMSFSLLMLAWIQEKPTNTDLLLFIWKKQSSVDYGTNGHWLALTYPRL